MRLVQTKIISGGDNEEAVRAFEPIKQEITAAIAKVVNPAGASDFAINPIREGNGVVPLKRAFIEHLEERGWLTERGFDGKVPKKIRGESSMGAIDAFRPLQGNLGAFAIEWETGNISSSHRAVNKMCSGILDGLLFGGALVLPSRTMYQYLTDRIGSYQELASYFNLWGRIPFPQPSILAVFEVEHDRIDAGVPLLKKGKSGNAKKD